MFLEHDLPKQDIPGSSLTVPETTFLSVNQILGLCRGLHIVYPQQIFTMHFSKKLVYIIGNKMSPLVEISQVFFWADNTREDKWKVQHKFHWRPMHAWLNHRHV